MPSPLQSRPGGIMTTDPLNLDKHVLKLGAIARSVLIKAMTNAMKDAEKIYKEGVKGGSLNLKDLSPTTLRFRKRGKEKAGLSPARPKSGSTVPLFYTGFSHDSVRVKRIGPTSVELGMDPSRTIPYSGINVRGNAQIHERGAKPKGRYSRKQLAFLHIMFRRPGSRGRRAREDQSRAAKRPARVGMGYSRKIPARPAFQRTRTRVRPMAEKHMRNAAKTLRRVSKLRFKAVS
jgi:hypothetical protein